MLLLAMTERTACMNISHNFVLRRTLSFCVSGFKCFHMQTLMPLRHIKTLLIMIGCLQYCQQLFCTCKAVCVNPYFVVQYHIDFTQMLYLEVIFGRRCGDATADNNRLGGA